MYFLFRLRIFFVGFYEFLKNVGLDQIKIG
jgi:hypothetical protein